MKQYILISLLFLALVAAVVALLSDGSYARLRGLRRSLAAQEEKNEELQARVSELKEKTHGIRTNDRKLEKAARNELGLARPNELIFLFEKEKNGKQTKKEEDRR